MVEGAEEDKEPESKTHSEDLNDEVDDPLFVLEEERAEEEPLTYSQSATLKSAPRNQRHGGTPTTSPPAQAAEPHLCSEPWKTEEADTSPAVSRFQPDY